MLRALREGAKVAVLDVNGEAAQRVAAGIGASALPLAVNVTNEKEVADSMSACAARFVSIHGLVNSAGIAVRRPVGDLDDSDWTRVIDVNPRGAFLCSKHVLSNMDYRIDRCSQPGRVLGIEGRSYRTDAQHGNGLC